jgi:hypothetical protein
VILLQTRSEQVLNVLNAGKFGRKCAEVLRSLPQSGALFPNLRKVKSKDRANEFRQRCHGLGIKGVSLHSYRYSWAERARKAGYCGRQQWIRQEPAVQADKPARG